MRYPLLCVHSSVYPTVIIAKPNQVAVFIGRFTWYADLVAVEVVGLLAAFALFFGLVMYLCQRFVRSAHTLSRDWRFHAGYSLLITLI